MNKFLKTVSTILIVIGIGILIATFSPVAKEEIRYNVSQIRNIKYTVNPNPQNKEIVLTPPNKDFSIVIPKIGAVSAVFSNIDPSDPKKYLPILKKGVAQAQGTALPDQTGNVFLFAHSTDAFYDVAYYNAVFYLIGKLNAGDEIDIFYKNRLIKYSVYDKKVVSADSSQYFGTLINGAKTLTLQTCYPPGTTLERLVVLAKQIGAPIP